MRLLLILLLLCSCRPERELQDERRFVKIPDWPEAPRWVSIDQWETDSTLKYGPFERPPMTFQEWVDSLIADTTGPKLHIYWTYTDTLTYGQTDSCVFDSVVIDTLRYTPDITLPGAIAWPKESWCNPYEDLKSELKKQERRNKWC